MTAQVYDTQRNNFLTTFIPEEPPYFFDFYLGEFSPYTALKNSANEFISLGGDRENPLTYKYQETGITDFTFSIIAPNRPRVTDVYNSLAWYELWIDGVKPYYFYFGSESEMIFTRTVSVMANKDQITKFKFRLTLFFTSSIPDLKKYYFEGDPDTVYSSVTAKFIPDAVAPPASLPIIYILSPQQLPTNSICVFTAGDYSYPLPTTSAVNDIIELKIQGANSYTITQGIGQKISLAAGSTTVGTAGSLFCNGAGEWVRLICTVANNEWISLGVSGDSFQLT